MSTYLVPQTPLLDHIHADIQDVLHQLLALSDSAFRRLLACGLLRILTGSEDSRTQNIQVACLNRNTHNLLVVAGLVAALEYPPYRSLEVLLDIPLHQHGGGMCTRHTSIATTWGCGVECVRVFAGKQRLRWQRRLRERCDRRSQAGRSAGSTCRASGKRCGQLWRRLVRFAYWCWWVVQSRHGDVRVDAFRWKKQVSRCRCCL